MTNIKSNAPMYKIIGELLVDDILSARYRIGQSLPTEKSLREQHQVSRHTVREALRYVENTGLIERRQGSGSKVISNKMPEKINQVVRSIKDILQHGKDTIFRVSSTDEISLSVEQANLLRANPTATAIQIHGVRIEPHDRKPVCHTQILKLAEQDEADDGLMAGKDVIKTLENLLSKKQIGKIEQTISACTMPKEIAGELEIQGASIALKIQRFYFLKNSQDPILVATNYYPENRFSYSTVLFPDNA